MNERIHIFYPPLPQRILLDLVFATSKRSVQKPVKLLRKCTNPPPPPRILLDLVFATSKWSVQKPMIFLMLDFAGPCLCYVKAVCAKAKKIIKGKCPPRRCVLMLLDFVGPCLCYIKAVCTKASKIIESTCKNL